MRDLVHRFEQTSLAAPLPAPATGVADLPDGALQRVGEHLSAADLARLSFTSRAMRALVARAGWGRAHYADAFVHGSGGAVDGTGWRQLAERRAELRAVAGRPPGALPTPPQHAFQVERLLRLGMYDAALVAMQPLPPTGERSAAQTQQLATALRGLGRATEADEQMRLGAPWQQLAVAVESGDVAAVRALLAGTARPGVHHVDALRRLLRQAAGPEAPAVGIFAAFVGWCVAHDSAELLSAWLERTAPLSLLAPVRVAMATALAEALRPEDYRAAAMGTQCLNLLMACGGELPASTFAALLAGVPPRAVPRLRRLLLPWVGANGIGLPFAHIAALLSRLPRTQEDSFAVLSRMAFAEMTPANLQQLQALGIDLNGRSSDAMRRTVMHVRNWREPGGSEALRHLIEAGADPVAADAMGRSVFRWE